MNKLKTKILSIFCFIFMISTYTFSMEAISKDNNRIINIKGTFSNINCNQWISYSEAIWKPITFNQFSGSECLRGNLSIIELPEDGVYSLCAHYYWRAINGSTAPYTAISLNDPTTHDGIWIAQHHLNQNFVVYDCLNRVQRFKQGDKVMVSVYGQPNAEYHLNGFKFHIEKLM